MSKITSGRTERRVQRYLGRLFEISVVLAVVPLVVHGMLSANGLPIA